MTQQNSVPAREARRKPRFAVQERVRMHWKDAHGHLKSTMADALDVSKTGIRVHVDKPIERSTIVNLECRSLKIAGVAYVRHCNRTSPNHYTVGLEFSGGLEWRGVQSSPA